LEKPIEICDDHCPPIGRPFKVHGHSVRKGEMITFWIAESQSTSLVHATANPSIAIGAAMNGADDGETVYVIPMLEAYCVGGVFGAPS
jgi:hypothetical protein